MNAAWALRALRWSYCAFIAWSSARTFIQARAGHDAHALVLASLEMLAIAAFVFRRTQAAACYALLTIYAIAAMLTLAEGGVPLRFVYFAMTAVSIVALDRALTNIRPGTA
jgi:hypothetical protein